MLRTNAPLLAYAEQLLASGAGPDHFFRKNFSAGSLLLRQDDPAARIYIIGSGIAKCFFSEANDKEFIVEFLGPGEIAGEIEAIGGRPVLCNVQAVTPVTACCLSLSYFERLLRRDEAFNRLILEELARRIVHTSSRASFQQRNTLEEALAQLLRLQSEQSLHLSKEDMAAYLGVTVRSLNRSLRKLG